MARVTEVLLNAEHGESDVLIIAVFEYLDRWKLAQEFTAAETKLFARCPHRSNVLRTSGDLGGSGQVWTLDDTLTMGGTYMHIK